MSNPFAELGLNADLVSALVGMGYETPSDIQLQAIPLILDGGDIVGLSQTGSGKTAAFSLPLLQMLDMEMRHPQILVVCPTRELSQQVAQAIKDFAKHLKGVRVANLYGGAPYPEQLHQLRQNPQVVVGTPGRLQDHLRKGTFATENIQAVVLDEADRMLDMGFRDEIREMLEEMPDDRQNIFFSATMNPQIKKLIDRFSENVELVQVSGKVKPATTIKQAWLDVRETSKLEILRRLILRDNPGQAVIFCNTKRKVEEAADALGILGVSAERLHGDMGQPMRERVLKRFSQGQVRFLIATDVAGRGLDVAGIEAVYVLEMSHEAEDYVHRVGRTGRAGRSGSSYSLVSRRDFRYLKNVERYIGESIPKENIPSQSDLQAAHERNLVKKLVNTMELVLTDNPEVEIEKDKLGNIIETEQVKLPDFATFEAFLDAAAADEIDSMDVINGLVETWKKDTRLALNSIPEDRGDQNLERDQRSDRGDRNDGSPKRERGEKPKFDEYDTLFFGVGKEDDVSAGQLTGLLYNEVGVTDGGVGKIRLFGRHTLVGIVKDEIDMVMKSNLEIGGRKVPIRPDQGFPGGKDFKGKPRSGGGGGGGGGGRFNKDRDRSGGEGRSNRDRDRSGGGYSKDRSGGGRPRKSNY